MSSGQWQNHKYIDKFEKNGRMRYVYENDSNGNKRRKKVDPKPTLVNWAKPNSNAEQNNNQNEDKPKPSDPFTDFSVNVVNFIMDNLEIAKIGKSWLDNLFGFNKKEETAKDPIGFQWH